MGFSNYDKIYQSTVVPVMDYGSEVWEVEKYIGDEIVQNQAARAFLGCINLHQQRVYKVLYVGLVAG